jgi:hypothetical protein
VLTTLRNTAVLCRSFTHPFHVFHARDTDHDRAKMMGARIILISLMKPSPNGLAGSTLG